MNIRIENPPADADQRSRYKALVHAARVAEGAWVAVDRNGIKDSPAQLRQRIEQAAGRAGVKVEVQVAARTAHVRTIPAVAQPASPANGQPSDAEIENMSDAELDALDVRDAERQRLVKDDQTLALAGFFQYIEGLPDCAEMHATLAEIKESRALGAKLMAAGGNIRIGDGPPELRALVARYILLAERAFRRSQCDPIDDPHPEEMAQLLSALEALESWLWGSPCRSGADYYRLALRLGREWKPEQIYKAIRKLIDTPCEPSDPDDKKADALRNAFCGEGLRTTLETILRKGQARAEG